MNPVYFARCGAYDIEALQRTIGKGLAAISFAPIAGRVLLKPNLVLGKGPGSCVNTHPAVVEAVAAVFLAMGCRVAVGDSPGYESPMRAMRKAGILDVVRRSGLEVAPFAGDIEKGSPGFSPYRSFRLAEDPGDYDLVVNLPKLKTHAMMGLTLGVKNTFGFVRGMEKAKWHLRAGRDRHLFARVLIDVHGTVSPGLTVLDGIWGMEGDGPTHGRPRHCGFIALSRDAFALDRETERIAGIERPMPVSAVAMETGLLGSHEVIGERIETLDNFLLPETISADWRLPGFVKHTLRDVVLKKPRIDGNLCRRCGICLEVCPAGAVSEGPSGMRMDYGTCIRCYCCQEMCPHGAIAVGRGL